MKSISLPRVSCVIFLIIISLFTVDGYAQYCIPAPTGGCINGDYPTQFALTGTTISINDPSLTCTAVGSSFSFGGYEDNTATDTVAVISPSTPSGTITANPFSSSTSSSGSGPIPATEGMELYVDWNNDGVFQSTESVGGLSVISSFTPSAFTITIPSGEATGYYRMRLVFTSTTNASYPGIDPCLQTTLFSSFAFPYSSGDAIDYTLYVGIPCTTPTVTLGATTCTSQVVNWTAIAGSAGYEYVVNTSATAPASGPYTGTTATTFTATGLIEGTTYYAHVRDSCSAGSYSSWVNMPFTTSGPGPISGTAATCPTSSTILSDAVAGGTWSSSATTIATIAPGGTTVYGAGTGLTTITYTEGGCTALITVTVAPLPALTGTMSVCPGSTTQLSDAIPGGTWSSSTPGTGTVSGTGLVYGVNPGTTTITYTRNGCTATAVVTVSTLPAITGGSGVCVGATLALSDATAGGTWSSSNSANATVVASTGVVTGATVGSTTITYTLGGCTTTETVTVGSALGTISGTTTFCVTSTTTLSDTSPGGVWSSDNTAVATITGGVVHGVTAGTATISYSAGGCSSTTLVTVVQNNAGTITGKDTVCIGNPIILSDAEAGGTWSSSNTHYVTVGPSTGVVTGVAYTSLGINITYTVTNICGTFTATYNMHVRTAVQCASGIAAIPEGQSVALEVFPNPNNGTFTMNLQSDNDEEVHVMITNIIGQKVKEFTTTTNKSVEIHLNHAAGIYLISATTTHGNYISKVEIDAQ